MSINESNKDNAGIAFLIVVVAGMATALGAAVVFIPSLVKFTNQKVLAASMGLSAGVMLYVSFVEILSKSHDSFLEAGHGTRGSVFYATACFFGGILAMTMLNSTVDALSGGHHHHHHHHHHDHGHEDGTKKRRGGKKVDAPNQIGHEEEEEDDSDSSGLSFEIGCPCTSEDPVGDLDKVQEMARIMEEGGGKPPPDACIPEAAVTAPGEHDEFGEDDMTVDSEENENDPMSNKKKKKLLLTGVNTALAIALHNFPEGLATFVAAMEDPAVGAVLGTAIVRTPPPPTLQDIFVF